MKCVSPFVNREGAFGCGQCLPCKVTKRRTWAHRILLEALDVGAKNCSFCTLTYDEDAVPRSVEVRELQLWQKRLRKSCSPRRLRFFSVGEYGDQSFRPHYHSAVFGLGPCQLGGKIAGECPCPSCSVVRSTWGLGHVLVRPLDPIRAQYIAGYVVKKMTHAQDTRLGGRNPEFARMSLKPGIGADAMHNVASEILRYNLEDRDVPTTLQLSGKHFPLGKYLRGKLRELVGQEEKLPSPSQVQQAYAMQLLRLYAFENSKSVKSVFRELNEPYEALLKSKQKVYERGSL